DSYSQSYEDKGPDMNDAQAGVHMHALVGENTDTIATKSFPLDAAQRYSIGASPAQAKYIGHASGVGSAKSAHLSVGDAGEAVETILEVKDLFGLTRCSAHMDVGAPDHATMMKSIEVCGDKIAPEVRKPSE